MKERKRRKMRKIPGSLNFLKGRTEKEKNRGKDRTDTREKRYKRD